MFNALDGATVVAVEVTEEEVEVEEVVEDEVVVLGVNKFNAYEVTAKAYILQQIDSVLDEDVDVNYMERFWKEGNEERLLVKELLSVFPFVSIQAMTSGHAAVFVEKERDVIFPDATINGLFRVFLRDHPSDTLRRGEDLDDIMIHSNAMVELAATGGVNPTFWLATALKTYLHKANPALMDKPEKVFVVSSDFAIAVNLDTMSINIYERKH